jgi:hypothetical protein
MSLGVEVLFRSHQLETYLAATYCGGESGTPLKNHLGQVIAVPILGGLISSTSFVVMLGEVC